MVAGLKKLGKFMGSFAAGVVAGAVYFALHTPTPAPPWPALAGLLGILSGEAAGRFVIKNFRGSKQYSNRSQHTV
ncbi:DUF1427 family protein [Arthrobacter sp. AG367]|uniref:DUF1427 family protein n=1 Tax=Arthrobacter sp. AG367 TaxID=2572909 RepID=UPI0011A2C238